LAGNPSRSNRTGGSTWASVVAASSRFNNAVILGIAEKRDRYCRVR
jgi:hypothetical protein